jgi:hypothetical protein
MIPPYRGHQTSEETQMNIGKEKEVNKINPNSTLILTPWLLTALLLGTGALAGTDMADDRAAPPDGSDAQILTYEGLRAVRYCELFFITGNPETGLKANFVNTSGLNNQADPKDTCPPEIWDKITPESLKSQYQVVGVFKNGPRNWTVDTIELPAGGVGTYDGLQARWLGKVKLPRGFGKAGATAYNPTTVARKSVMHFEAGQPVFILDGPDGTPWVMQAFTTLVDPSLDYAGLQTLGDKLKLAEGWSFRVKVLDEPLTIHAVKGIATIVQDDLQGTYDACKEGSCGYQP